MYWDIKQDLTTGIKEDTSKERLAEIIHNNVMFADNGTHHNEAVNGTTIDMTQKQLILLLLSALWAVCIA
eukprot:15366860-Ditylum_brightwellii.AAC.1